MPGPDPHGPDTHSLTFARRLISAAKVVASLVIVIGVILAVEGWKAARRNAGIPVDARGPARPVPVQPEAREQAVARDGATIEQAIAASAFVVIDLSTGRAVREQKSEWLDAPVWPGSIAKLATFAAAIDAGALTDATRITCARRLTLPGGRRVDCSHPPVAHPLSAVDALANSCNFFTATIARGLTREQLSSGFVRLGLSPVPADADLITSAFGLGGAQVAPRKLVEAVRRAADIPLIREGLRSSARTGTSAAFAAAGIEALAKTGTAPMRGGRALGLVAAVTPADAPRRAIVVALPGGSGAQAAETAAAILRSVAQVGSADARGMPGAQGSVVRRDSSALAAAKDGRRRLREVRALWTGEPRSRGGDEQRESSRVGSRVPEAPGASAAVRIGRPTAKGYDVESVDVEEYVARVVAGETSDATPAAAREALAIAARTFAHVNRGRHAGDGFDLCTLTHCQVTRSATRSSRAAANATRERVLVDDRDGRPAPVFYSASCGGTIADARTLLPNADPVSMPWLVSRSDPAGIEEVTWQTDIPADDLLRALQQSGSRGDTLRNLIAHAGAGTSASGGSGVSGGAGSGVGRGAAGGAVGARGGGGSGGAGERTPTPSTPANLGRRGAANAERGGGAGVGAAGAGAGAGTRGPAVAAGGPGLVTHVTTEGLTPSTLAIDDFRRAIGQQLGWQLLKSTRFTVQRTSRGYRFTGRGHGHGVGLCVLGASALAARGADAARILQEYFPGLQATTSLDSRNMSRNTPAAPRPVRPSTIDTMDSTPAPAINLRLPSGDERERRRLMRLIGTNLKELSLDLSLPSPSGLDVVVHPTVAAYRRATRSPSWTSAATILSGDDITLHFAPLATLERGSMLTQTVRHELVHVLTIRALFDRPRWVHEGLALHLAGERVSAEPEETSGDAVKCPSDRDLMRPRSRDAFDRAYSRAAACVARDLAAGRNWRDLGAR